MPPIPPLNFTFAGRAESGDIFGTWDMGNGDWNVNVAGSGFAAQSATSGVNWMLIAAAVGVAFFLLKK